MACFSIAKSLRFESPGRRNMPFFKGKNDMSWLGASLDSIAWHKGAMSSRR